MVSIKIDFGKKDFVWIGLIVVLLSVGFGIAFGGTVPSDMGHSAGELAAPLGCSSGHSLIWNGVSWDCGLGAAGEDRVVVGAFGDYQSTKVGQVGGGSAALVKATDYTAATDGFVVAQARAYGSDVNGILQVLVDGVVRGKGSNNGGDHDRSTVTVPVKKDDVWKVNMGGNYPNEYTIFWVPVESGSGNSQQVSKTTASSTSSTSFVDLPGMSMDVTTSGGNLMIMFNTMAASSGGGETFVRILIDGVEKAVGGSGHTVQGKGSDTISLNWLETSLAAGTYNIKMQWRVYDQTSYIPRSNVLNNEVVTATLIAMEL